MEKYIVNGHEIEYDTFDLDCMEAYEREARKIDDLLASIDTKKMSNNYVAVLREVAESVLDFFDAVLGEGMAREIFGERTNFRDIKNGYRDFTQSVIKVMEEDMNTANRAQRRAAKAN